MLRNYIFNTEFEKLESLKIFRDDTLLDQTVEELFVKLPDAVKRCYAENPEYLNKVRAFITTGFKYSNVFVPSIELKDIPLTELPEYAHVVKHYSDAYSQMIKDSNELRMNLYRMSDEEFKEKYPLALLDCCVSRLTSHFQGKYDIKVYLNTPEKIYSSLIVKSPFPFDMDIKDFVNEKVYESLLNYYK